MVEVNNRDLKFVQYIIMDEIFGKVAVIRKQGSNR
ncbi:MAG: hypothetical protein ACJAY7_001949 [Pseudohongiellaceae bacterium]|jgi:hypothetical protein